MDAHLNPLFTAVDRALTTLLTSITTYNPNPAHANELVAADNALRSGLSVLQVHQQNQERIQLLQRQSDALDAQIRETLSLLVRTREKVLRAGAAGEGAAGGASAKSSAGSHAAPEALRPVDYTSLLEYAGRISKFTLPSNYRADTLTGEPARDDADEEDATGDAPQERETELKSAQSPSQVHGTNGITGPAVSASANANEDIVMGDAGAPNGQVALSTSPAQVESQTRATDLPGQFSSYLDPHNMYSFVPWPHDEQLRRGALATVQAALETGKDLGVVSGGKGDGEVVEAGMDTSMEAALPQQQQQQQQRQNIQAMNQPRQEQRKEVKQFSLDDLDDDDDDDD